MTTKDTMTITKQAAQAIMEHDPCAWGMVQHDEQNFSARVGLAVAYYVIIDGKIIGDVWYE